MTATMNGKARKSLSDQLDRLDSILDVLANGLNEAIADAVKNAVSDAVQQVLTEVLTNAELQNCLRGNQTVINEPQQPASPSFGQQVKGWFNPVARSVKSVLTVGRAKVGQVYEKVAETAKTCWAWTSAGLLKASERAVNVACAGWRRLVLTALLVKQMRKQALVSLTVGTTIGLGCYLAGPVVAASVSGLISLVLTWLAGTLRQVWFILGAGSHQTA
jgi:hypothetical protein